MDFSPFNAVVARCLQGMALEEKGMPESASEHFLQAWETATTDFEKFIAAYYVARCQKTAAEKLKWLHISLQCASDTHNEAARSAFPTLYRNIAKACEELGEPDQANAYHALAAAQRDQRPTDKGPFYHGTKADLALGELLTAGGHSNYQDGLVMNHVYFTALAHGAGLAAALARGEGPERVYIIEPTGSFEDDPNVTDKKFPGNLTRSYRSLEPLKIIGELSDWQAQTPEELQKWRAKLASNNGAIIN